MKGCWITRYLSGLCLLKFLWWQQSLFLVSVDDQENAGKLEVEICCRVQEAEVWEGKKRTCEVYVCLECQILPYRFLGERAVCVFMYVSWEV